MARLSSTTVYGDINISKDIDVSGLSKFSDNVTLGSDLVANNGETIWDESATYIPQGRLQNDTVTIEGNSVSLGGSTSVNHNDLSTISSDDHHSKYTDSEAITAVEGASFTSLDTTDIIEGGTTHLSFDGSGNVKIPDGDLNIDGDGLKTQWGENQDFSIFYENASDDLVVKDESNGVELIRQPKAGATQFIQGADIGSIEVPEDSYTQIINVPSTSSASSGDKVGYTFAIDNQTVISIEGEADGNGGISGEPDVFVNEQNVQTAYWA